MTWIIEHSGSTPWGHPLYIVRYRHGTIGNEPFMPTPALLPHLAQDNPRFGPLSEASASRLALLLNDLNCVVPDTLEAIAAAGRAAPSDSEAT